MAKKKPKPKRPRSDESKRLGRGNPAEADESTMTGPELLRRELFAREYLALGVGWRAAEAAGYTGTKGSLTTTAVRLLKEPGVIKRMAKLRRDMIAKSQANVDLVWGNYFRAANASITDVVNDDWSPKSMSEIDEDARDAIASVEIEEKTFGDMTVVTKKVKMHDKLGATEKIGKLLGMFKDEQGKMELSPDEFIKVLEAARGRSAHAG